MRSFDVSIDQRFIVFGGSKPMPNVKKLLEDHSDIGLTDSRKIVNIVSIEPFSYAQKGFEQRNEDKDLGSLVQTFEDQGSLSIVQIMQVKSDKKKKQYFVFYSTQNLPGLHIVSLSLDKNKMQLRKVDFTGLESISQIDDHMVNFCVYQNSVSVHCHSKISMIVFKSKSAAK